MERVLEELLWKSLLLHLDDVIAFLPDFNSHVERLDEVLRPFRTAGLKLKLNKCDVSQKEVRFLGHVVSEGVFQLTRIRLLQ